MEGFENFCVNTKLMKFFRRAAGSFGPPTVLEIGAKSIMGEVVTRTSPPPTSEVGTRRDEMMGTVWQRRWDTTTTTSTTAATTTTMG